MARGDGGKKIFVMNEDRLSFLHWLERVCESHGWRVHAWVLMGNHFHLLLETPEPNLSCGMRLLLGSFGQAWNVRRSRRGHVFQGRYKAIPISESTTTEIHYFKVVADYIHLNPARAGLAGGPAGPLVNYHWSSLKYYHKGPPPDWQPMQQVLDAFGLAHTRRGRKAYLDWLEARASKHKGRVEENAMKALRKGWCLGDEAFKDKLLELWDKMTGSDIRPDSVTGAAIKEQGYREANRLIAELSREYGLPADPCELSQLRKGDARKVICAALIKARTSVSNQWLAERLHMGHPSAMSQLVNKLRKSDEWPRIAGRSVKRGRKY